MSRKRKRRPAKKPPSAEPGPSRRRGRWGLALLAAAAALAALVVASRPGPVEGPPWNLLLVSIDTLRPDHLSAYGGEGPTPHMDRLAAEGVLFERVQSPSPTTLPAHASLFTGLAPPEHGVRDNVGFYLSEEPSTLASHLRSRGYRTGGFVGAFVLDARFGIGRGFDTYFDEFETLTDDVAEGFVSQRRGGAVVERALAWLDEAAKEPAPFFAFVHLYDPHTPYDPPAPFHDGRDDARALYRGEVAYADALVGELLAWLDARDLTRRTLVVLTSDHGESLGEHEEQTHGFFVYESTLRVPLVMRYPGAPAGSRVGAFTRLVDVAPTVLDLLEEPGLGEVDGVSLVPLVEDGDRGGRDHPHYAETFLPRLHYGWSELRSLRSGSYKLILAPRPELYDLESDPAETRNLYDAKPDVADRLRRTLEGRIGAGPAPEAAALDATSRARLEALGYVAGGTGDSSGTSFFELPDPKDRVDVYRVLNDPMLEGVADREGPALQEALARLEHVLEGEEEIPRAYLLYGELLLEAGRLAEAERAFESAVRIDAGFEALYGLGMVRQRRGALEEAEEAYLRAHAAEPRNTKSHFRLAEVASARGDVAAAVRWLEEAIAMSPNRFLKERLASLLLESGRAVEARAVFEEIVHRESGDPRALYNLAQTHLVEGNAEVALELFRRAAEADPRDPDVQQGVGNALVSRGDLEGALAAFRRAAELSPCFAGAHANAGTVLAQLERSEAAVAALEQAVVCDPGYVIAYKNLAAVHLESGDLAAAIEALERGRKVAPGDAELARHLADLRAFRDGGPQR